MNEALIHGPHTAAQRAPRPATRPWKIAGVLLLAYAVLGNYAVLPGYRRFLARGGRSEAGNTFDSAVFIGATKTILWMFSFQFGAFCLAYAALCAAGEPLRRFRRRFAAAATAWLCFWALPRLPEPGPIYFASLGCFILGLIVAVLWRSSLSEAAPTERGDATTAQGFRICSYLFFALATWEVCGLGSVGRILHPDELQRFGTGALVATQMTKLIVELLLAWSLALLADIRSAHLRSDAVGRHPYQDSNALSATPPPANTPPK
jgi:hypothetical protein